MSLFERGGAYNPQNERKRRLGKAASIALAATTAITGASIFIADKMAHAEKTSAVDGIANLTILNEFDCPPTDPQVLEVVGTIFSTKDPKELKTIGPEVPNKYDKYVKLQAKRFGVTLQNPNSALDKLFYSKTIEGALAGFNDFLSGFSYTATIPTEKDSYDEQKGMEVVSAENLDPLKFAVGAYGAINALQYLPTEVAKLAGDVEIRFVNSINVNDQEEGIPKPIGLATFNPNRIYVDINAFYFGYDFIIPHEIGHQIDISTCGIDGFRIDSEYASLNPSGFAYIGDNYVSISDKDIKDVAVSAYGASDIAEDKATVMEKNLTEAEGFGDMAPVVRSKFELIISRIEERAPRYAGYLRAISRQHGK